MNRIITGIAAFVLASSPMALAADQGQMDRDFSASAYDANDDGNVTVEEFDEGLTGPAIVAYYDTNDDGRVDAAELAQVMFIAADENRDGELDSDEMEAFDDLAGRSVDSQISQ